MKSMLKILLASVTMFILGQAFTPIETNAQYITRLSKDSVTNAGTRYLTFTSTPNLLKGISVSAVASTGTLSLVSVTLEHRIDTVTGTSDWTTVPTTAVSVASTISTTTAVYTWDVLTHGANGYRIKVTGGGTQKTYLYASYLRRTQ